MNRFEKLLNASPRNQTLLFSLLGLALVSYFIPWLVGGSTSLRFGAYDLAEWISLRLPDRPMQIVLLLRVIPVLLAMLIGLFGAESRRWSATWWLSVFTILFIAVGLLPPFEFFLDSSLRSDMNYSQQFQLSGAALILGLVSFSGILRRFQTISMLFIGVVILVTITVAILQTWDIVEGFGIMPRLGLGPMLLVGSILTVCLIGTISSLQDKQIKN
jgi:hypothetical protein